MKPLEILRILIRNILAALLVPVFPILVIGAPCAVGWFIRLAGCWVIRQTTNSNGVMCHALGIEDAVYLNFWWLGVAFLVVALPCLCVAMQRMFVGTLSGER